MAKKETNETATKTKTGAAKTPPANEIEKMKDYELYGNPAAIPDRDQVKVLK